MPDEIEVNGLSPGTAEQPFQTQKEKLKEITDGIEQGIKNLFASGEYAQYLKTMSRFHSYSLNNIMLIFMQKPNATMVAGFTKWKDQFDRHVNKGEKAIKIIAPVLYNKKVEREKRDPQTQMVVVDEHGEPVMEEITIRVPKFKVTSVFDVSQTEGKPLPALVHDIYGSVKDYDVFMEAIRRSSPVPMDIVPMDEKEHGDGYFSRIENHTYIREGMSQVQTVCASIHEMAHSMLHTREALEAAKLENPEAKPKTKAQIEVEAESVSYACYQYYGIETKENSFGYIASWSKNQDLFELKASLETISKTASAIITNIDRNLKEIVHEREAEQQNQGQANEPIPAAPEKQEAPFLPDSVSITPAGLLTPDCGTVITMQDLADFGYPDNDLLPLTKEKAYALFDQDAAIYALYENGSADMLVSHEEITAHTGFFGIEYNDWINTPDYAPHPYSHQQFYEAAHDVNADLFRCLENGKLYMPGDNELFEYVGRFEPFRGSAQTLEQEKEEPEQEQVISPVNMQQAENYRISDDHLGEGGAKTKFKNNMTAIYTLKTLEAEGRPATPEEQEIMSRYVGWGGLANAFDPGKKDWSNEYEELKAALTPEEYKDARASTLNAHYTSPTVIRAVYEALGNMGFKKGNILEPAMGVGNFFGMLPESMRESKLYGVELDSITGRLAQKLYPKASITVAGFETTDRHDFYDVAVGNVPFGNYKVNDRAYNKLGFIVNVKIDFT